MELYENEIPIKKSKRKIKEMSNDSLENLTVFLTNSCNAKCKYCYEERGNKYMDITIANKMIEYLMLHYNNIDMVSFFGGEPLLCFDVIKHIVKKVSKNFNVKRYKITTNAVLFNDEIIEYLNANDFEVIISMDGPKFLHNNLRIGCDYDIVINAIEKIKKRKLGENLEINCTYTKYHQDSLGYDDLEAFFDSLKVRYSITEVISENPDFAIVHEQTEEMKKIIDKCYKELCSGLKCDTKLVYVNDIINALVYKEYSIFFCDDLHTSLAFGTDGKPYPCTKLIDKCKFNDSMLNKINRKEFVLCRKCWANGICSHCAARYYLKEEKISDLKCEKKDNYEYALIKLVSYLHYDPQKFYDIIDNFYK